MFVFSRLDHKNHASKWFLLIEIIRGRGLIDGFAKLFVGNPFTASEAANLLISK